jgi:hypothetical protein
LVAGKKLSYFWGFCRDKAQAVAAIAAQEPTDGAIAKTAVAIEDDQQPVADLGKLAHPIWMKARWRPIQFGQARWDVIPAASILKAP